ncbi:prepilin peptidase [Candidatus Uhrbacteria bacterium]|nr:prepilin peptidase [Candidatus Uhrbacteria bacterium]
MFEYIIIFIFGTIVGSFLNALVWRLSVGESVLHGRSYCTDCHTSLNAGDLIPLLSFFLLRRRCRYCRSNISWRYPIIEACGGLLFVLAYSIFLKTAPDGLAQSLLLGEHGRDILLLIRNWFFISVLLALFYYDLRWSLLPDSITLPAIVIGLVFQLILLPQQFLFIIIAALVGAGFFAAQYLLSRGAWIGGGDIRLGALMGVMLGWPGVLLALFVAYIVGAAGAIVLLALKLKDRKSAIPFGPFLAGATGMVLLYGDQLMSVIRNWYGI